MKTLKNFLAMAFAMIMVLQISNGQDYKHPFNVNASGHVMNAQGVKLGWIEKDGTIRNAKGEVVGKVEHKEQHPVLVDKVGKKMGAVSDNGTFKDEKGNVLYTVSTADKNGVCKILDASGKEVGTVHENYKQQAGCVLHCLSKK